MRFMTRNFAQDTETIPPKTTLPKATHPDSSLYRPFYRQTNFFLAKQCEKV